MNIVTDTTWLPELDPAARPKYLALAQALRQAVVSGELVPGTRLPPVRDLAWRLKITPGTAARAYSILTQEGLLTAGVGRGTFVAEREGLRPNWPSQPIYDFDRVPGALRDEGVVDLRAPQLPEVGQGRAIGGVLAAMAARMGQEDLDYPNLRRDRPLRQAMLRWLSDSEIGPAEADDLVLSHGGQNGINIALQCCLAGDRPLVAVEELSYAGFRHAVRLNRGDVVPVEIDAAGLRADRLDEACRRHGTRIVCITTEAQNPTTVRMPLERRQEIVAVARAHDLQIIEDDCYMVRREAPVLPSLRMLAPERVWFVSSLSKSISAGLRFGAVVCPEGRGDAARLAAQHSFFGLARPLADLVYGLLDSGQAGALRDAVQADFDRRLELTVAALGRHALAWRPGLSFLWLRLPRGWRASTFAREAEARGVMVRSADEYALASGGAPNAVRIALAAGIAEDRFAAALATLSDLLDNPPADLPV